LAPLPGDVKIQPDQIAIFKNVTPRKSLCRQTNCMFERSGTRRPDFAFSGGLPVHRSHGPNAPHPVASPQMSFGYMSCKDAGAKQADEYRDRFNHLMDYPLCWKNARLIADLCCRSVSSGRHNGFIEEQVLEPVKGPNASVGHTDGLRKFSHPVEAGQTPAADIGVRPARLSLLREIRLRLVLMPFSWPLRRFRGEG
jgi:hypothetical protein